MDESKQPRLTILSFGGGQDSTALLYKYHYDKSFRDLYAPEDFLVVMAATNNEHKETDEHTMSIKGFCVERSIDFIHITTTWVTIRVIGRG